MIHEFLNEINAHDEQEGFLSEVTGKMFIGESCKLKVQFRRMTCSALELKTLQEIKEGKKITAHYRAQCASANGIHETVTVVYKKQNIA